MNAEENVSKLERQSELADARLGVAEDFAWPVAGLAATLAYSLERGWLWALAAFIVGFAVSIYPLRKAADKAEDAYFRAAKLGKYATIRREPASE